MNIRKISLIISLAFFLLFIAGCSGSESALPSDPSTSAVTSKTTPASTLDSTALTSKNLLIVDDDGSRDGTAALLYLLNDPQLSIEAVTISYGEAHPELYIQHIGRMLDNFGMTNIPLGAGQDEPLSGGISFPNWLRLLSDQFWEYPLPNANKTYPYQNAPELMVNVINQAAGPVTLFLSGPFTNLAQALTLDPTITKNISAVYFMGGAVNVPGNITNLMPDSNNQVAEWNILADPQAAKVVFESGLKLYMVPLDATHKVILRQKDLAPWRKGNEKAKIIADLYDIMFKNYGMKNAEIFDLTAAVIMIHPESCTFEPLHLDIVTEDGPNFGQTRVDPNTQPNILACLEPNAKKILQSMDETFLP